MKKNLGWTPAAEEKVPGWEVSHDPRSLLASPWLQAILARKNQPLPKKYTPLAQQVELDAHRQVSHPLKTCG